MLNSFDVLLSEFVLMRVYSQSYKHNVCITQSHLVQSNNHLALVTWASLNNLFFETHQKNGVLGSVTTTRCGFLIICFAPCFRTILQLRPVQIFII